MTRTTEIPSAPLRRSDVSVEEIGDETLLYDAHAGTVHVLNSTARLVWDLCDGEHTVSEIAEAIEAHFSVPAERDVLDDVRNTLASLVHKGLLRGRA